MYQPLLRSILYILVNIYYFEIDDNKLIIVYEIDARCTFWNKNYFVISVERIGHVSVQCDALNKENLWFCVTFRVKRTMPQNFVSLLICRWQWQVSFCSINRNEQDTLTNNKWLWLRINKIKSNHHDIKQLIYTNII